MEEKDWEQRLKEKWYLWNYNKELGNYTTCENEVIDFIEQELDRAREEGYQKGYEKGLEDLHSNDIYQEAVCFYGEWSQEGMDKGFEEARKELLSKLTTK
jgi:flagellar biosynthesis/type III secretory pathway protein FliH